MIVIKTCLDSGIYKSEGGGEIRVEHEYTKGPRNLVKAAADFWKIRESNIRCYGNIGCGKTWLEVDGQLIDPMDFSFEKNKEFDGSPVSQAKALLEWVASGSYDPDRYHNDQSYDMISDCGGGYEV